MSLAEPKAHQAVTQQPTPFVEEPSSLWERLFSSPVVPVFITSGLLIFCLIVAWVKFVPIGVSSVSSMTGFGALRVVSFDPVKFINAQRAAASILATKPSADLALTMTQVARQSQSVIREEAQGAVVLIRQSLVLPEDVPDITDQVLRRFGLNTDVPTVSTESIERVSEEILESYAPTDSALSAQRYEEDARLEYREQLRGYEDQLSTVDAQRNLIP